MTDAAAVSEKRQRAIRMANIRVPHAITSLQKVGELVKQDLTPEHRAKIVEAISTAYEALLAKFQPKPEAPKQVFSL